MGYLACYCSKRFVSSGFKITNEEFPGGEKLCNDWITSFGITNGLMIGIVGIVSVTNLVICYLLAAITRFERHHSVTNELVSETLKILIAQFINSVFLLIT